MGGNDNLKRIILATVISFIFFVAYDYFVIQPQMVASARLDQNRTQQQMEKRGASISQVEKSSSATSTPSASFHSNGKIIGVITGKEFQLKIDQWGRIVSFKLTQHKFEEKGKQLELIAPNSPKPLEIRFKDPQLNREFYSTTAQISSPRVELNGSPKEVTITHKLKELTLVRKLKIYPDGHYEVKITLSKPVDYFISPGYRPDAVVDNLTIHGGELLLKDGKLRIVEDGEAEKERFKNVVAAAGFDRYYITLLYDPQGAISGLVIPDREGNPQIFLSTHGDLSLTGYIGPKYVDRLKAIDPKLVELVQYGLGTFFARNLFLLLDWFHKITGDWGLAIILLVIFVRILLFPLTWKGMVSMHRLKELAPKIKELQERYKKDPATLQKKMMELYQKHNVNPLGGCLPLLLQIPVFYGIYKLLLYSIELKGAHFLWIKDLASMDPYFILPVLMGVTMYLHQKVTPTNFQDPMQEKVFKLLPIIFTFLMATFPAGLVLYWTVNNILSLLQQLLINRLLESKGAKNG